MRLLIVEDDAMILKGLTKGIDWEGFGFDSIRSASDGEIGLSIMQEKPADIVITDINMPFMDGLQLAEIVNREFPDTIVIILTGYQDFEYAKKAIHSGVFEYLIKPVPPEQLEECIQRAINCICEQKLMEDQIRVGKEKLINDFFEKLLFKGGISWDSFRNSLSAFNLPILEGPYIVVSAHFDDYENPSSGSISDFEETADSSVNLCQDLFGKSAYIWRYGGDYLNIIGKESGLRDRLEDFITRAEKEYGITFVTAVSSPVEEISKISLAGQRLRDFQKKKGFLLKNTIIWEADKDQTNLPNPPDIQELIKKYVQFVYNGQREESLAAIKVISDYSIQSHDEAPIYNILYRLSEINRQLIDNHILRNDSIQDFSHVFEEFIGMDSSRRFLKLREVSEDIFKVISDADKDDSMNSRMVSYIHTHFSDPMLSLTSLGDYMGMSPVYLCSIFKKRNGISFAEYVTAKRMEEACRLLRETTLKVYEVSKAVGIANPQYFNSRFKQLNGLTPLEYRMEKRVAD